MNLNCPYAIFDMDGTLIDSVPFWSHIGQDYLRSCGCCPEENLEKKIVSFSLNESAEYFHRNYLPHKTADVILREILSMMDYYYRNRIPEKTGSVEYLRSLKSQGIILSICSSSDTEMIQTVLSRLDILHLFTAVVSCQEVGAGKHSPAAYLLAMERMGAVDPAQCAVYEDAFFAMKTARTCGMKVIGVYDAGCEKSPEEIRDFCDDYIFDFTEALSTELS